MSDKEETNGETDKLNLDESATDSGNNAPDDARREFLKRFGTYAAATPPTVTALLLPSKESFAQYAPGPTDGGSSDGTLVGILERLNNAIRALIQFLSGGR